MKAPAAVISTALLAGCAVYQHRSSDVTFEPPQALRYESLALPGFSRTIFDVADGVITKRHHGIEWDGRDPVIERRRKPSAAEWGRFWQKMRELRVCDWETLYQVSEGV